jgi:hypothetical protein
MDTTQSPEQGSSISEDEDDTYNQYQTADEFLNEIGSVTPIKLSEVALSKKLSTEALLLKLIETDIKLFIISPDWELEVDELIEMNDEFVTREVYELVEFKQSYDEESTDYTGNISIPISAHTAKHLGYLRLTKNHLLGLANSESITIKRYWTSESMSEYIDLIPSRKFDRSDICLDENKLSELETALSLQKSNDAYYKMRADGLENLHKTIAGLVCLLTKARQESNSATTPASMSNLSEQILRSINEDSVSVKTISKNLQEATKNFPPASNTSDR